MGLNILQSLWLMTLLCKFFLIFFNAGALSKTELQHSIERHGRALNGSTKDVSGAGLWGCVYVEVVVVVVVVVSQP